MKAKQDGHMDVIQLLGEILRRRTAFGASVPLDPVYFRPKRKDITDREIKHGSQIEAELALRINVEHAALEVRLRNYDASAEAKPRVVILGIHGCHAGQAEEGRQTKCNQVFHIGVEFFLWILVNARQQPLVVMPGIAARRSLP